MCLLDYFNRHILSNIFSTQCFQVKYRYRKKYRNSGIDEKVVGIISKLKSQYRPPLPLSNDLRLRDVCALSLS